jgi:hypothetical protein
LNDLALRARPNRMMVSALAEANALKGSLIEELNDYVPLPLEMSSFSPPPQKVRGNPYSPFSRGGARTTKKKGGRKRSHSR